MGAFIIPLLIISKLQTLIIRVEQSSCKFFQKTASAKGLFSEFSEDNNSVAPKYTQSYIIIIYFYSE